jgi:glycosyltransferase involved in cell wall biosynthesis
LGACKTIASTPKASTVDFIFIHRETSPIGPPIIEWLIAKVLRKKIIYDFDDAIWLTDKITESRFENFIRWRSKVANICKWAYKISCGNDYLASFARKFNNNVVINPTTIDTENLHTQGFSEINKNVLAIGWTGSTSTLKYLNQVESAIKIVQQKFNHVSFIVIADREPTLKVPSLKFIPWNKASEVQDLLNINIGIMPLPDDDWAKGKCGFKALQYLALGIPCIASPVGVNTRIIEHNKNGFLASTEADWVEYLSCLITNDHLRKQMGHAGRKKILDNYSVVSNGANFLSLFE